MVDTPNDALQSHKVSGQNSPRGRVGGQKSRENPENPENSRAGRERGTVVGDHFGTIRHISVSIDGTSPTLLWWIALMMPYEHCFRSKLTKGQGLWAKNS